MAKVLPTLDESEPVHGDIDTVDSLAAQHAVSHQLRTRESILHVII